MTRHYCTLFDINYVERGIALWSSLMAYGEWFHLYILCMDPASYYLLLDMKLENVTLVPLVLVESRLELEKVRTSRSWLEYCWTMASQFMQYIVENIPGIYELTYLDSDLYFFSSPEPIFAEMGDASIAIVPHRFYRGNMRLIVNGVFNVGWLTIRMTTKGLICLLKWAAQCRDWCYHRNEGNFLFGDQGYLNSWPYDYGDDCKVIENPGAGAAPWNIARYDVRHETWQGILLFSRMTADAPLDAIGMNGTLIFYHFHEFQHDSAGNPLRLTRHPHTPQHRALIYEPYIRAIRAACNHVHHLRLKGQSERV